MERNLRFWLEAFKDPKALDGESLRLLKDEKERLEHLRNHGQTDIDEYSLIDSLLAGEKPFTATFMRKASQALKKMSESSVTLKKAVLSITVNVVYAQSTAEADATFFVEFDSARDIYVDIGWSYEKDIFSSKEKGFRRCTLTEALKRPETGLTEAEAQRMGESWVAEDKEEESGFKAALERESGRKVEDVSFVRVNPNESTYLEAVFLTQEIRFPLFGKTYCLVYENSRLLPTVVADESVMRRRFEASYAESLSRICPSKTKTISCISLGSFALRNRFLKALETALAFVAVVFGIYAFSTGLTSDVAGYGFVTGWGAYLTLALTVISFLLYLTEYCYRVYLYKKAAASEKALLVKDWTIQKRVIGFLFWGCLSLAVATIVLALIQTVLASVWGLI